MTSLFQVAIVRKRHLLLVRQRARQIARLLGLPPAGQALFAASTFELAFQALEYGRATIRFTVQAGRLIVEAIGPGAPATIGRHELSLGGAGQALASEDVAWTIRRVAQMASFEPFEEIRLQNREALAAWAALADRAVIPTDVAAAAKCRSHAA